MSQSIAAFTMARNSRHQILSLLQNYPLTSKERQDLMPRTDRGMQADGEKLLYLYDQFCADS